eukprot:tig00000402_g237.t1
MWLVEPTPAYLRRRFCRSAAAPAMASEQLQAAPADGASALIVVAPSSAGGDPNPPTIDIASSAHCHRPSPAASALVLAAAERLDGAGRLAAALGPLDAWMLARAAGEVAEDDGFENRAALPGPGPFGRLGRALEQRLSAPDRLRHLTRALFSGAEWKRCGSRSRLAPRRRRARGRLPGPAAAAVLPAAASLTAAAARVRAAELLAALSAAPPPPPSSPAAASLTAAAARVRAAELLAALSAAPPPPPSSPAAASLTAAAARARAAELLAALSAGDLARRPVVDGGAGGATRGADAAGAGRAGPRDAASRSPGALVAECGGAALGAALAFLSDREARVRALAGASPPSSPAGPTPGRCSPSRTGPTGKRGPPRAGSAPPRPAPGTRASAPLCGLYRIVRGVEDSDVIPRTRPKSMLAAKSFNEEYSLAGVTKWLHILARELVQRMRHDFVTWRRRPRTLNLIWRGMRGLRTESLAGLVPSGLSCHARELLGGPAPARPAQSTTPRRTARWRPRGRGGGGTALLQHKADVQHDCDAIVKAALILWRRTARYPVTLLSIQCVGFEEVDVRQREIGAFFPAPAPAYRAAAPAPAPRGEGPHCGRRPGRASGCPAPSPIASLPNAFSALSSALGLPSLLPLGLALQILKPLLLPPGRSL